MSPTHGARIIVDARSGTVRNKKRKQGLGVQQGGQTCYLLPAVHLLLTADNAIEKCYYLADVVGAISVRTLTI